MFFTLFLKLSITFANSDCPELCLKKANFEATNESGYGFENQQQRTNFIGKCITSCQNSKAHHDVLSTIYGWPSNSESSVMESSGQPTSNIDDSFESAPADQRKGDSEAGQATRVNSPQEEMAPPANAAKKDPDPTRPSNQVDIETPDLQLCEQAKADADGACDSQSKNWVRTINQASTLLGSQMNQSACGTLAAAQVGSAAALTLFSMQCGRAVDQCVTECNKYLKFMSSAAPDFFQYSDTLKKNATDALKACNAKGVSAKKTEADVGSGIQQIAQAVQSCRASFGTAAVDPSLQGPGYVGKPDGDILAGLQQRNDQGLNHEGTGSGLTGDMNANVDLSDLTDDAPVSGVAKPRGIGQDPGGQQGSAGLGSSGGVGVDANSGRAANRKGSTGLLSNILSGFFGSGGGGLFGGGKAAGSGDRGAGGNGYSAGTEAGTKTPDLRQFLPGAKFDPKKERNIAGRIVSKDGLIGPHGNLWRDVSNRYQVKRASLLP